MTTHTSFHNASVLAFKRMAIHDTTLSEDKLFQATMARFAADPDIPLRAVAGAFTVFVQTTSSDDFYRIARHPMTKAVSQRFFPNEQWHFAKAIGGNVESMLALEKIVFDLFPGSAVSVKMNGSEVVCRYYRKDGHDGEDSNHRSHCKLTGGRGLMGRTCVVSLLQYIATYSNQS